MTSPVRSPDKQAQFQSNLGEEAGHYFLSHELVEGRAGKCQASQSITSDAKGLTSD